MFKALADPSRRLLLDRLFEQDGRTLISLEAELPHLTRFGVMKHLKVLEAANLVITDKVGREKLHYLNPVPIRLLHDRWIDKYTERRVAGLVFLGDAGRHSSVGHPQMERSEDQLSAGHARTLRAQSFQEYDGPCPQPGADTRS